MTKVSYVHLEGFVVNCARQTAIIADSGMTISCYGVAIQFATSIIVVVLLGCVCRELYISTCSYRPELNRWV